MIRIGGEQVTPASGACEDRAPGAKVSHRSGLPPPRIVSRASRRGDCRPATSGSIRELTYSSLEREGILATIHLSILQCAPRRYVPNSGSAPWGHRRVRFLHPLGGNDSRYSPTHLFPRTAEAKPMATGISCSSPWAARWPFHGRRGDVPQASCTRGDKNRVSRPRAKYPAKAASPPESSD